MDDEIVVTTSVAKDEDEASQDSVKLISNNGDDAKIIPSKDEEKTRKKVSPKAKRNSAEKPRDNLGFRKWDSQQKAVDEFHQKEAERKAREEKKKADGIAAREAEVYQRTQTGFELMKKEQAAKERLERLRREEEAKRKEEEAHAKHHNLRKEMEAAERAKQEAEEKARIKKEAKRRRQLEAQALKMKKFDEDRRWKTLPNWKKDREKELLLKVDQLIFYDPQRNKYEFFDVHRVPDAWDEEFLDSELKKAKYARGEELLKQLEGLHPDVEKATYFQEDSNTWDEERLHSDLKRARYAKGEGLLKQLQGLLPGVEKVTYFQEETKDQWNIEGLEKDIRIQTEEVLAEEKSGAEAFGRLLLVFPDSNKEGYWDGGRRPRWLLAEMNSKFEAQVEVILSGLKHYKPDIADDLYFKDGEWQVTTMQADLAKYKFEEGDALFKLTEEIMKLSNETVDRTKYFNENQENTPWNLELMEKDRDERVVIKIQITKEEDETNVRRNILVRNEWSYNRLLNELSKIIDLPETEIERLTVLQIDEQKDVDINAKLGDLMKHHSVVVATLAAPINSCCIIL